MSTRALKQAAIIGGAVTVFAVALNVALVSAFDQPVPHHLAVAFTGNPALVGPLRSLLQSRHPGAFRLEIYPNVRDARAAVLDRRTVGAVVAVAHQLRLLVAQAGGASPARTLTDTFGAVAAATGRHLVVTDLVPPASGDTQALSPFFIVLGMLFPSLATGAASSLTAPHASIRWRFGLLGFAAVFMGLVVAAVADGLTGLGSYPATVGIIALFSLAVSAPTAALSRIKAPAVAIAVAVFIVLGISSSGGPSGLGPFAPSFFRAIDTSLPVGAAATVLRNTLYFHGYATTAGLGVLSAWAAGGLALLVIAQRIRQAQPYGNPTPPAAKRPDRRPGARSGAASR